MARDAMLISSIVLLSTFSPTLGANDFRSLVAVGGALADDNAAIYGRIVDLAGGVGVAKIGILTTASGTPLDGAHFYSRKFHEYGAAETHWFPVTEDDTDAAYDSAEVAIALDMSGFFFGGGDQARIVEALFDDDHSGGDLRRLDTPLMAAIRAGYESGAAVVGGTSAGADALTGAVMVLGGESYDALADGAEAGYNNDPAVLSYDPLGGIGLLPEIAIDTHFSQRGRQGRMIRLLSDTSVDPGGEELGTSFGFGMDEDTALVVISDLDDGANPVGEVVGSYGGYFVDVSAADVGEDVDGNWNVGGVITHYLTEGDFIDLSSWSIMSYADYKSDVVPDRDDALTSDRVFSGNVVDPDLPGELAKIAEYLMQSTAPSTSGDTLESNPTFTVYLDKRDDTVARAGYKDGDQFRLSYEGLMLVVGSS